MYALRFRLCLVVVLVLLLLLLVAFGCALRLLVTKQERKKKKTERPREQSLSSTKSAAANAREGGKREAGSARSRRAKPGTNAHKRGDAPPNDFLPSFCFFVTCGCGGK